MNLNSIHYYKKKGKLNKQTITQGIQPSQQTSSLQLRNKRYLQMQSLNSNNNNHPSVKTMAHQVVNYKTPKQTHSLTNELPPSRNLSTVHQLIKAEQDQQIMNILRSKFSQQFPDEISGLVLNNKFKAQNLNMNINIHYNGNKEQRSNSKKHKLKLLDEGGLVMTKNFKYPPQQQQYNTIDSSKQPANLIFNKPYSSSISRNQKFKSFLNQTYQKQQNQTLIPTYEHIYSKRPNFQKPKRVKTEKTKPSKSLNSRYFEQPQLYPLNSTLHPFHWRHHGNYDRYETEKQAETIDLDMKERYKSLDLRERELKGNQDNKEIANNIQNNNLRMSTQVTSLQNGQKKPANKPRRVLTQQEPKDQKKRVYQSIDLTDYRNKSKNLKRPTQKVQSKNTAINVNLNKNKHQKNSKPITTSGIDTIKNEPINNNRYQKESQLTDDKKPGKRFLLAEEKGKKSLSLNQISKRNRYDDQRDDEMPGGVRSFNYNKSISKDIRQGFEQKLHEEQLKKVEKYEYKELYDEITRITEGIVKKRQLESRCFLLKLIKERCSFAQQDEKISKSKQKYEKDIYQLQHQLENLQAEILISLSQNSQIAINFIIADVAQCLNHICKLPLISAQHKKNGLDIESKLVLALEKQQKIKMKEEAGYHVEKRNGQEFLGVQYKVLLRVLGLLETVKKLMNQQQNGEKAKKQGHEIKKKEQNAQIITDTVFKVKYLLSLSFLSLIAGEPTKQLTKKIVQLSLNLSKTFGFSKQSQSLQHQQFISPQLLASTCIFHLIKELSHMNQKLNKLNHCIKDVNPFVEVYLFKENETEDRKVKLTMECEQFIKLIDCLKESETHQNKTQNVRKVISGFINIGHIVANSFKKISKNKESYLYDKISLCQQMENEALRLLQSLKQSVTENQQNENLAVNDFETQLKEMLIHVKLIKLHFRRKQMIFDANNKDTGKIISAVQEYLKTQDQVNSLIDQSELNISKGNIQQQSIFSLNAIIFSLIQLPSLCFNSQTLNQQSLLNNYLHTCQSFSMGESLLMKSYILYMKKDYYQCQIFIQQSLPKTQQPYLIKLLSLTIAIKLRQNSFYQAYHQLQRFPYYGIFLDKITPHLIVGRYEAIKSIKETTQQGNNDILGHRITETCERYFLELECLELFVTGVVLLMKRKLQEGLVLLNQAMGIVQFVMDSNSSKKENKKNDDKISSTNSQINNFQQVAPQFITLIYHMIHSYLAYAHYCLNHLNQSQQCLKKQQSLLLSQCFSSQIFPSNFSTTINYNLLLCTGLKQLKSQNYLKAIQNLKQSLKILNKPEPHAYLALAYYRMWGQKKESIQQQAQGLLQDLYIHLSFACSLVQEMNNNFSSSIFYLRSLYYTWQKKLELALLDVDQSIDKAEQNYPKHFYLRALILALSQNFKQAINQASIAISINEKDHQAYLLRSRCCQIEGDQNQAFVDLQTYINLRPDDMQIHKYAGHLLFENGAFEDALSAYQQGDIHHLGKQKTSVPMNEEDFHVFLTKSKTYFLLGNFRKAAQEMKRVVDIKSKQQAYQFDYQMMAWLDETVNLFANQYAQDQAESIGINVEINQHNTGFKQKLEQKLTEINKIYSVSRAQQSQKSSSSPLPPTTSIHTGKIFKQVQLHMFKFILFFYLKSYKQARKQLMQCISIKQLTFTRQKQNKFNPQAFQQFQEEQNEKELFINQMRFNLVLVLLKMKKFTQAEKQLAKCKVEMNSKGYKQWKRLMWLISGQGKDVTVNQQQEQQNHIRVYSDKNKLSKFFPDMQFSFQSQNYTLTKLMKPCLPYPKVQPPQISPKFDIELLNRFSEDDIEKKPQAPWIKNEKNSIKFTQEIKTFSRLDIDYSEAEEKKVKRTLGKGKKGEESSMEDEYKDCEEFDQQEHMIKKRSSKLASKYYKNKKSLNNDSKRSSSISSSYEHADIHKLLKLDQSVEMKLKKLIK